MSHKRINMVSLTGAILLAAVCLVWSMSPEPALAQCGTDPPKSSCVSCHEKQLPELAQGVWHGIHAYKDCCTNCHGGNCRMMEEELAHESLVAHPLDDIYTNCHACHPDDYTARAEQFGAILGITPRSGPTPTPVPAVAVVEQPIVILPLVVPATATALPGGPHRSHGGAGSPALIDRFSFLPAPPGTRINGAGILLNALP